MVAAKAQMVGAGGSITLAVRAGRDVGAVDPETFYFNPMNGLGVFHVVGFPSRNGQ